MRFTHFKLCLCTVLIVAMCIVSIHYETVSSDENFVSAGQEEINKQTIADHIIVTRSVNSKSKPTPRSKIVSKSNYMTTHKSTQWFNTSGIKTNRKLPTLNGTVTETQGNNIYPSPPKQNSIFKTTYKSPAASKIRTKKSIPTTLSERSVTATATRQSTATKPQRQPTKKSPRTITTKPPTTTTKRTTTKPPTTTTTKPPSTTKPTTTTPKPTTRTKPTTTTPKPTTTMTKPTTTTKPPPIPSVLRNSALFGGLAGTALGLSLASRMSYVNKVPAYTVQHYWHTGLHPVRRYIEIQNTTITGCTKNVSFCIPGTMIICLSNGEIYCVVPQDKTRPCTNATMGECLNTTLAISCKKSWKPECLDRDNKWRYEGALLPCISHIRVKYAEKYTTYDEKFIIPEGINKTCSCNDTKVMVRCVTLVNTRIICSGVNLSNNILVSMNTNLTSKNAKYVSCLPTQATNSEALPDIFAAQSMSLLSRCEPINSNSSTTIEMMCGYVGNLSNVSIPIDANVITMSCEVNSTQIRNDTIKLSACDCNSTASFNRTEIKFNTTSFCVYVAAFPAKPYTNVEYFKIMNTHPEEKKKASASSSRIVSAILNYIFAN